MKRILVCLLALPLLLTSCDNNDFISEYEQIHEEYKREVNESNSLIEIIRANNKYKDKRDKFKEKNIMIFLYEKYGVFE
ncbi:MAG: hypothetical protein IIW76_00110 [Bacteroidales bacterium]|nr:hypothetical protein [Bacteroidales bacterium]